MNTKVILHIIDSLQIGGAEILLINANVLISGYRHVVVYLKGPNRYESLLQDISFICLDFQGWSSLPKAVNKLRRIISQENAQIIHSHLFYSTIIARLACPNNIKLITSYHSLLYNPKNITQYSKKLLLLDRLTYRKRHHLLFVSKAVQTLICKKVGVKRNHEVLYNYVQDKFYYSDNARGGYLKPYTLRLVVLGNLRPEKNYPVVIQALTHLSSRNVVLDIYGEGSQRELLQGLINQHNLGSIVNLKGRIEQPYHILPNYDLYIAASKFEGFGVALTEAMATGLPCLASDIETHREIARNTVVYFNPDSPESLAAKINQILDGDLDLRDLRCQSRENAKFFKKDIYLSNLAKIYERLLAHE